MYIFVISEIRNFLVIEGEEVKKMDSITVNFQKIAVESDRKD